MWGEFKKWSDYFVNKREIIVNLACIANKLVVTLLSFLEKIIFLAKNKKDYINYSKVYKVVSQILCKHYFKVICLHLSGNAK